MTDTAQNLATTGQQTTSTTSEDRLPIVAYQGTLELLDARWDLASGRTVKFRLVSDDEHPLERHPFAEFAQRRSNKMGTRFKVAFARVGAEEVFFSGEVALAGGGNPLGSTGMWVKFWLDEETSEHPFAGCTARGRSHSGDLFVAAFVELDDDDAPIDQGKRDRVERAHGRRQQSLAQYAAMLSVNELFAQWLAETVRVNERLLPKEWWMDDDRIARWIRWLCKIESRSQLDMDEQAAQRFHDLIRRPYAAWRNVDERG